MWDSRTRAVEQKGDWGGMSHEKAIGRAPRNNMCLTSQGSGRLRISRCWNWNGTCVIVVWQQENDRTGLNCSWGWEWRQKLSILSTWTLLEYYWCGHSLWHSCSDANNGRGLMVEFWIMGLEGQNQGDMIVWDWWGWQTRVLVHLDGNRIP